MLMGLLIIRFVRISQVVLLMVLNLIFVFKRLKKNRMIFIGCFSVCLIMFSKLCRCFFVFEKILKVWFVCGIVGIIGSRFSVGCRLECIKLY